MDVLSLGVLPDESQLRLSCRIGDVGFYLDMDRQAFMQLGFRMDQFGMAFRRGLPSNPAEDWRVNDIVNGAVEACSEPLEPFSGEGGVPGANLRITVFGLVGEGDVHATATVQALGRRFKAYGDGVSPPPTPWGPFRLHDDETVPD